MWNLNAPQGRIPCAIFTKFAEFVPHFRMRQLSKCGWICWRGYGVMGVLSWGGLVCPKFSAPPSGETMCQTPNVLEVQERAWGPLSLCQVCWGSDFTCRRGGQKRWVFCLFVCLSVRHAFERQSLRAADFAAAQRCLRFLVELLPPSAHESLTQTANRLVQLFLHNWWHKVPILYSGHHYPQNCLFP